MKKLICLSFAFFATQTLWAEPVTLKIKGMHCASCEKTLTKKVCQKLELKNCQAKVTDRKSEAGELSFETDATTDLAKVKSTIVDAGYEVKD